LDEIEKAHQEVFNMLLQVLDDGRLTDGHGRTVDFKNTVIIMTSNIASQDIREFAGGSVELIRKKIEGALFRHFRPEFINRIGDIILFQYLGKEAMSSIVDIQLKMLSQLIADRKIELSLTKAAREALIEEGFDPTFGARPLKRVMEKRIKNGLAMEMLKGTVHDGAKVVLDFRAGEYVYDSTTTKL
jgi:ATP-dependent Clp protease ATP-binding subunit ClpB